ncbi:2'-5' RNA ligase family protein [Streptomyces sp. NPDC001941]|uniref:2'-5' RNA ligase family protein n=1 Tax=Streptomyces sp. NPDC001941 TaxID=3154659 RepID=UPI00332AFB7C
MTDKGIKRYEAGLTALVVRIPEADPVVGAWRERYDPSAALGVPAHVSVLYPFLDAGRTDEGVHAALAEVFARHQAFDVRFERCGRFPGMLYLAPEPAGPFRELTEDVVARWPEAPPYGGRFGGSAPHLTVALRQEDAVLDEVEGELRAGLPFASRVTSVDLVAYDGTNWEERASFALGG